ncbi:hypothetical protein SAMN05518865_111223 [Duganella sp. CF458]|uniref:ATP-grasp domain-containing protein n=1 Tax=Duganella sp. CF458 TaxID=1884368 RepID=UPI0008DFE36D|nr:hypothetical protein [Duganella sp. CF458]SFG39865.1 hypothetical protein SAMN05518865_111223 [Duganella sp. CF458]
MPKDMALAWQQRSDSDLWGLLGRLFDAHPGWSDAECRETLQAWREARRREPWQVKLLIAWPRWRQHHQELRNGLAQAGHMSWPQKCRYCEIWSANRPVMSPFCGIAEILLEVSEPERRQLQAPSGVAARRLQSEVVVVSSDATVESFAEFGGARQLIWALETSGLSWSLHQPWSGRVELDTQQVKAVVFWSYRHRSNDFVYHAMAFEEACRTHRIPVINSIQRGWDVRHSTTLNRFREAGVHCPRCQKFSSVEEIELAYPLILRVDGIHQGQQMQLVHSADEARALVDATRARFLLSGGRELPPPNLAIEFIDVADAEGMFHKYRAYVVGSKVIVRHKTKGPHWLVNFASSESTGGSGHAKGCSTAGSEADAGLLVRAGRASGSDVTALDYSITRSGEYVFWEANRLFKMNGDKGYDAPSPVAESMARRRAAADRRLGESLKSLLQERLGK